MKTIVHDSKAYIPETLISKDSNSLAVYTSRNTMKKIFALSILTLSIVAVPIVNTACAGGANGRGYGMIDSNENTILAGTGSSGGYGKVDADENTTLAGSGNGGGYGMTDGSEGVRLAGTGNGGGYGKIDGGTGTECPESTIC